MEFFHEEHWWGVVKDLWFILGAVSPFLCVTLMAIVRDDELKNDPVLEALGFFLLVFMGFWQIYWVMT